MEKAPNHQENVGEVVSMEQAREVLGEIAQELEARLVTQASSAQITALRRAITN